MDDETIIEATEMKTAINEAVYDDDFMDIR